MSERFYSFTREELYGLLRDTMFLEFRDRHGHDAESAKGCAAREILAGLDAEDELHAAGECGTTHVREGPSRCGATSEKGTCARPEGHPGFHITEGYSAIWGQSSRGYPIAPDAVMTISGDLP